MNVCRFDYVGQTAPLTGVESEGYRTHCEKVFRLKFVHTQRLGSAVVEVLERYDRSHCCSPAGIVQRLFLYIQPRLEIRVSSRT